MAAVCVGIGRAGRDPGHELSDLAKALRIARVHGGVRVIELERDGDRHERELSTQLLRLKKCRKDGKKSGDEHDDGQEEAFCDGHFLLGRVLYEDGRMTVRSKLSRADLASLDFQI